MKLNYPRAIRGLFAVFSFLPLSSMAAQTNNESEKLFWEQVNVISAGLHTCKEFISPNVYDINKKTLRNRVEIVTGDRNHAVILLQEINEKLSQQFPDPATKARNDHRGRVEQLIDQKYAGISSASKEEALSEKVMDEDIADACEERLSEHFEDLELTLARMGLL